MTEKKNPLNTHLRGTNLYKIIAADVSFSPHTITPIFCTSSVDSSRFVPHRCFESAFHFVLTLETVNNGRFYSQY